MPAPQKIQRQVHMYFLHLPLFCASIKLHNIIFNMELACPQETIKYIDPHNAHLVSYLTGSTGIREDIISIHLGPAIETETDLELSVTLASPNTQHDVVVEGTLNEGAYNNKDFRLKKFPACNVHTNISLRVLDNHVTYFCSMETVSHHIDC